MTAAFDAVAELRSGSCASAGAVLGCDDNGFAGRNPIIGPTASLGAGTYCVIVDGVYDDGGTPGDPSGDIIGNGEFDLAVDFGTAIP